MSVKMTAPKIDQREAQPYLSIRQETTMDQLPVVIPSLIDETFAWLGKHDIAPAAAPFIRYNVIDMECEMDIEIGVPVAKAEAGDQRVKPGTIPAGHYASLVYTDVTKGVEANAALLDWGAAQGLKWDQWDTAKGDAFGGRFEHLLMGPEDDPDPANWDTEVAIRLKD